MTSNVRCGGNMLMTSSRVRHSERGYVIYDGIEHAVVVSRGLYLFDAVAVYPWNVVSFNRLQIPSDDLREQDHILASDSTPGVESGQYRIGVEHDSRHSAVLSADR